MRVRSDAELLARAGEDPGAFAEFYARHEAAALAFAGGMVRDPEVTIDVVAETFARAYASREGFRGELGAARAWLLGIARHVVIASWRTGTVQSAARTQLAMRAVALSDVSVAEVERLVLESEATVEEVWLADLPVDQREAVRRRVLAQDSYAEIARELSCSEAVVRQRVSRGLAALRRNAMGDPT